MELGDRVRFDRELVKERGNGWKEKQHQESLMGSVCGKRTICLKGAWEPVEGSEEHFCYTQHETKDVCLIATDLRGFHRVPEEWIEEIKPRPLKNIVWDDSKDES